MNQHTGAAAADTGDSPHASAAFLDDVRCGLAAEEKSIPCKYFYDARGSQLFDQITQLEEYYPTRTELAIMARYVDEMVERLGPRCLLVEYGSGSSLKTRILLEHMREPAGYVPIDISGDHLAASARRIARAYPGLDVRPVTADYTSPFHVPDHAFDALRTVVYFPGSTIGNFEPPAARDFLLRMRRVAGPGGGLLIGVDLAKDPSILEAAYNDARGVTAAFNKNLLCRINRELGATFDLDAFRHEAVYNVEEGRIEMYLISRADQVARLGFDLIRLKAGERIRTEYSYKYTLERFTTLASDAALEVRDVWVDEDRLFSVQYLEAG